MFTKFNAAESSPAAARSTFFGVFMCQTHFFERASRQPKKFFLFWACGGILYLRATVVPPIRTIFSLTRLIVAGT
jgi:hypothetical protein